MRPEVRVLNQQEIIQSDVQISSYEADSILAKYGYKSNNSTNVYKHQEVPNNNLTFEEMARLEEEKQNRIKQDYQRRISGPNSIRFGSDKIKYSETK